MFSGTHAREGGGGGERETQEQLGLFGLKIKRRTQDKRKNPLIGLFYFSPGVSCLLCISRLISPSKVCVPVRNLVTCGYRWQQKLGVKGQPERAFPTPEIGNHPQRSSLYFLYILEFVKKIVPGNDLQVIQVINLVSKLKYVTKRRVGG